MNVHKLIHNQTQIIYDANQFMSKISTVLQASKEKIVIYFFIFHLLQKLHKIYPYLEKNVI